MNPVKLQGLRLSLYTFLCTNNELLERESKKTILFKSASKRIKYLWINLTTEVKDLYCENYDTDEGNWDDTKKWKDTHIKGLEELKLLKCPDYPKQSPDLMQSLSKYPWHFS